jgi:hypothetical protein
MTTSLPLYKKVSTALGSTRLTEQQVGNLKLMLTQVLKTTPSEQVTIPQMEGLIEMAQAATPDLGAFRQ